MKMTMNAAASDELRHEYFVMIRECHLDTFGHVNNATYLQLFEEARWELITSRGFGLAVVQREKLGPVILEAHIQFRREVKNRETVKIVTSLLSYEGKIGRLKQDMWRPDGRLACGAEFACGLWNTEERKLVPPTPAFAYAVLLSDEKPGGGESCDLKS